MMRLPIPGFIDLQVNGYKGVSFSDINVTEEKCVESCEALLAHGTAAFLPTIITNSIEAYQRNLPLLGKLVQRPEFRGRLLGLHVEGPFISDQPGAVGAHSASYVKNPDIGLLRQFQEWADGQIRILTIASERPGALELIPEARKLGIVISLGHSLADESQIKAAQQAGATALTHIGNGIPNMLARHPNPIWSALATDGLHAMFIPDGHHLPDSFMKVVIQSKGVANSIAVSDTTSFAAMKPGRYGNIQLHESGRLDMPERGCLAGSALTMLECMNHLAGMRLLNLNDQLACGFYNPLALIGKTPKDLTAKTEIFFDEVQNRYALSA